ncbi:MAG: alkaline phosphatase family protein [Acidobacteria bacterium]|nr:alkaline phosphatase family protein [Acidobacteriota bacterium]
MTSVPARKLSLALLTLGASFALLIRWVPADSIAVLQNRVGRSYPQVLRPGIHWRIPLWESISIYSTGPLDLKGTTRVRSRDGIEVLVPFSLRVRLDEEIVLKVHQQEKSMTVPEWIRKQTEESLRLMARRSAAYQLLRESLPSSLQAPVESALKRWGFVPGSLKVGPGTVAPEILASFSAKHLSSLHRPTGAKVVLIGLDGADWDFALPMIERGELPNLARLRREGAYGKIRTNNPPLSPLLWTTVATGKSPDTHGINDFLVLDPRTGQLQPISSDFRKVKALWNIASDAGLTSEFVAWWATWPAESIRGIMVSDRVSYSLFNFVEGGETAGGETFPEGYFKEIKEKLVGEQDITLGDLSPMVHVTSAELAAAKRPESRRGEKGEDLESLATLIRIVASTKNYQAIALDLLNRQQPDLFAVYFQGIDEVNHRFAHLAPPRMPNIAKDRFNRYSGAVAGFYRLQDRMLGEILRAISPDSTVIVLSDHGFAAGSDRPENIPPFISGQPGLWHAPFGILLLWGAHVKPGPMRTSSLYDILPTVLDLLGLPPAEDLPGKSLEQALSPDFLGGRTLPPIASYDAYGDSLRVTAGMESPGAGAAGSEALVETLRSLGYVGPAPSTPPGSPGSNRSNAATTALYHANLAAVLTAKGDLDGGEAEFKKALESNPDTGSALMGLSRIQESKGRPDQALALLQRMVGRRMYQEPSILIRMAELFQKSGREEDGLIYFEELRNSGLEEPLLDTATGMLYSALNRPGEAEKAFRQALLRDPLSLPAMEEFFLFSDRREELPSLVPDLEAAIHNEEGSFMHHNWLALAYRRQGNLEGAERELKRAADLGPDQVGPVANLGSLYLQENRVTEAVAVLEQALARDPASVEVRTNLLVGLGRMGKLDRARELFEEGNQISPELPSLYNAMAFAFQANGHPKEAVDLLSRSLSLDSNQPPALNLLRQLDPGAAARISP